MSDENAWWRRYPSAASSSVAAGIRYATSNYRITYPRGSTAVSVYDKVRGVVFRIDGPHKGCEYHHLNINKKISGIPDPHIKIPKVSYDVAEGTAKVLQGVNEVLIPAIVVNDTARMVNSVYSDVEHGTTRNTAEMAASIVGGYGGGIGGAKIGSAVGSMIFPGIGTIMGAICGGMWGGQRGASGAVAITSAIGDKLNWNLDRYECQRCGEKYNVRKYIGQSDTSCPNREGHELNMLLSSIFLMND